jgi:integrase
VLGGYIKFRQSEILENLLAENSRSTEASIMSYVVRLKNEQGLSYAARNTILSSIKHFYRMNDVEMINWYKVAKVLGENNRRVLNKRPYTREEIQKMLAIADLRMRMVILLLASTGMGIGALNNIVLRNIQRIPEYSSHRITIYEGSGEEYYTFCTPECSLAIDSYLQYRERCGEKLAPSSPLIRKEFDKGDSYKIHNAKKMITESIGVLIIGIIYTSGIQQEEHQTENSIKGSIRKDAPRAHAFGIFFNTTMVKQKVSSEARQMLMGHTLGLNDAYYKPSSNDILLAYLKAVDMLTINEVFRHSSKFLFAKCDSPY